MCVIPFPCSHDDRRGTIHVMGEQDEGFIVSHESASGGSWGESVGPFLDGQSAITAAYALNRDTYAGDCNVAVCDAAIRDDSRGVVSLSLPGEF